MSITKAQLRELNYKRTRRIQDLETLLSHWLKPCFCRPEAKCLMCVTRTSLGKKLPVSAEYSAYIMIVIDDALNGLNAILNGPLSLKRTTVKKTISRAKRVTKNHAYIARAMSIDSKATLEHLRELHWALFSAAQCEESALTFLV